MRCPQHDMPDCSPLLNGCSLLTSPPTVDEIDAGLQLSLETGMHAETLRLLTLMSYVDENKYNEYVQAMALGVDIHEILTEAQERIDNE